MHTLDSRSLRLGDCFGQRFPVPGEVRYFVSPGELVPSAGSRSEGGYLINVLPAASGKDVAQHNVVVSLKDGSLTVSPEKLEIRAGDGVLWHTTDPAVNGFHVAGAGPKFHFNSASIQDDALYTHVFGVPGRYEWLDPNGSGISGTINVETFAAKSARERDQWFEILKKPGAIKIKGKSSSPASVKIVVGQTVFWSISDSPGVAIIDKRFSRAPQRVAPTEKRKSKAK
jgi:plastocyanin